MTGSRAAGHFERLYRCNPDPWGFDTSPYEQAKYRRTLAALGDRCFTAGLEVGCSIGILTRMLALRCSNLLGVDIVQQLSLFNAHYDGRCFLPIHVYDAASGHCVVTILRPGKTPDGKEVRAHLRRLVRRIRLHWPNTVVTIRGDGHYGRQEAMAWCERTGVQYVFGLSKNAALDALVYAKADEVRTKRAIDQLDVVRDYTETRYAAKSWPHRRRVVARFEATPKGFDTRYVVTNIVHCGPQSLYDSLYCARGQAENLIKRHKCQLASDRTSCRSPLANQMRLILHIAAYWLLRTVGDAIPRPQPLASAEFSTIRLRLLKVAVRIKETARRVRLAFASNCPDAALFRGLVGTLILRPT